MKIIKLLLLLAFGLWADFKLDVPNDVNAFLGAQSVKKQFLIAKSTKSYKESKQFATNLAKKTGIRLNFRGLSYNKSIMLSESKKVCDDNNFEYPCYAARGRYDDGIYISIEHSGVYENFSNGYYIVMVASGKEATGILKQIKIVVKDAYIKTSKVYMGCMH